MATEVELIHRDVVNEIELLLAVSRSCRDPRHLRMLRRALGSLREQMNSLRAAEPPEPPPSRIRNNRYHRPKTT